MGEAQGCGGGDGAAVVTIDHDRWAEALAIERLHGERGTFWVAEYIAMLALVGA